MALKLSKQVAIRYSDDMLKLMKKLMAHRKAPSIPDYLRGLILLDASQHDGNLIAGHGIPGWLTRDERYLEHLREASKARED